VLISSTALESTYLRRDFKQLQKHQGLPITSDTRCHEEAHVVLHEIIRDACAGVEFRPCKVCFARITGVVHVKEHVQIGRQHHTWIGRISSWDGSSESSSFSIGFRGISRLGSAYISCDDSNLHIAVCKQHHSTGERSKELITNFNRKSISRNTTHRQSYNLQAMLTGVKR